MLISCNASRKLHLVLLLLFAGSAAVLLTVSGTTQMLSDAQKQSVHGACKSFSLEQTMQNK